METQGPGCIDRMWFTYKSPIGDEPYDLLIYIDSAEKPLIHMNLDAMFSNRLAPFIAPLASTCAAAETPGRYSYVPIAFQKFCKVVLLPTAPPDVYKYRTNSEGKKIPHIYYQITYRMFEPNTKVQPFQWNLSAAEQQALLQVQSIWSHCGQSPWPESTKPLKQNNTANIEAHGRGLLHDVNTPGTICDLHIKTDNPAGLQLLMTWDNAPTPQVSAPLGPFFSSRDTGSPATAVQGLWTGFTDGSFYCYLPMPFRKAARIEVANNSDSPVSIQSELYWIGQPPESDTACFHAYRYDYNSPDPNRDYEVLNVIGSGHFAGIVMDRPGHMEGDDSFFIDGAEQPAIHGTGTEDFFNFAWGLSHTGSYAMHGITIQDTPICYRMHIPAMVPFTKSLRISWEHGHDSETGPNTHTGRYSGVVFYYLLDHPQQR